MIKVAIVDSNQLYLKKLCDFWRQKYGSAALLLYAFESQEQLKEQLKTMRVDVILASDNVEINWEGIPARTLKVYLLSGQMDGEMNGLPALAKNGNAEELYSKMVELYENHMNIGRQILPGQMVYFTSTVGGVGTSSCALAFGKYLASTGSKVLYLNLEAASAMDVYLNGSNDKTMEDVFYLCETNRKNIDHSLSNLVSRDSSGLYYVAPCRNGLELLEKKGEDIKKLLAVVTDKGAFDVIIIDREFLLDEIASTILNMAHHVVLVTKDDRIGRKKHEATMNFLKELDNREENVLAKLKILYNRSQAGKSDANVIGVIPEFSGRDAVAIIDEMSGYPIFDDILEEA